MSQGAAKFRADGFHLLQKLVFVTHRDNCDTLRRLATLWKPGLNHAGHLLGILAIESTQYEGLIHFATKSGLFVPGPNQTVKRQ